MLFRKECLVIMKQFDFFVRIPAKELLKRILEKKNLKMVIKRKKIGIREKIGDNFVLGFGDLGRLRPRLDRGREMTLFVF